MALMAVSQVMSPFMLAGTNIGLIDTENSAMITHNEWRDLEHIPGPMLSSGPLQVGLTCVELTVTEELSRSGDSSCD